MSIQRTEIEGALPPAPKTMLSHVHQLCIRAGVPITEASLLFAARAITQYLAETGEGKQVMLKLLNSTVVEGSYMKQYYPEGFFGEEAKKLDHRALIEYRGWIFKGKAYPWQAVEIENRPDLEHCDGCGGKFPKAYCAKNVRVYSVGKERLDTLCNHCRLFSDDPKVRDTASQRVCGDCSATSCQFHPKKAQQIRTSQIAAQTAAKKADEPPHPADDPTAQRLLPPPTQVPPWYDDKRFGAIN